MGWATLFNPVVPSGAVLCTRRVLFRRSGAVPVCFAEASGGSSVGEQRGVGRALRVRCVCASAVCWRAMADRGRGVSRTS